MRSFPARSGIVCAIIPAPGGFVLNREATYLAHLLRARAAGRTAPVPAPESLRWNRIRELLLGHRLVSALCSFLDPSSAPPGFLQELGLIASRHRIRSGFLLLELARFLPALEETGARPIILKGAAFSHTVYAPGVRFISDLDVLVDKNHVDRACACLRTFGYEMARTVRHRSFYELHHFHRILRNRAGVVVEIHWELSRPTDYFHLDPDSIRARANSVSTNDITLRLPSNSDQLLHTAAQALGEGYADLRRVMDAAALLGSRAAEDAELAARAHAQGLAPALWALFRITGEITGAWSPPGLMEALRPSRFARTCLRSLDLAECSLLQTARERTGLKHLIRWLCSPNLGTAVNEIRAYVLPGEVGWLDHGHSPTDFPGGFRRVFSAIGRAWSVAKIVCYQGWRLASSRRRGSDM